MVDIKLLCSPPRQSQPGQHLYRLSDDKELWRVSRKDLSERSWGTPLIHQGNSKREPK